MLKDIPCERYSDATPEEKIIRTLEIKREAEAIVQLFKVRFKERTKYQEFVRYSKKYVEHQVDKVLTGVRGRSRGKEGEQRGHAREVQSWPC